VNAPVEASPIVDADVSTGAGMSGPISAPMVAALEAAWAAIRLRHPEVPAVVLVLGAGSIGTSGGLRLGHFAAMRWADPDQTAATRDETDDGSGEGEPGNDQPARPGAAAGGVRGRGGSRPRPSRGARNAAASSSTPATVVPRPTSRTG